MFTIVNSDSLNIANYDLLKYGPVCSYGAIRGAKAENDNALFCLMKFHLQPKIGTF